MSSNNDIANDLFILNKYTVDKLFASDNPSDCFALYGFYYKTAKWQKTNTVKANDKYVKMCLKWGADRVKKAKNELKELGLIQLIQRRKDGKVEGWYVQVEYMVSDKKTTIAVEETHSNNTQNQQVGIPTSRKQETNALKQKDKCLKTITNTAEDIYEVYKTKIKASTRKQSALNNIRTWLKEYTKEELFKSIDNYSKQIVGRESKYIKECSNFFGVKDESKGYFIDFIELKDTPKQNIDFLNNTFTRMNIKDLK